jgi:uncharacterized protein (DUF58 family)
VLAIPAARRGRLAIGRVMLETRFPLDLFRAWSYVEPDAHCLVYPRPLFSALPDAGAQAGSGKSRSHAAGNDDFAGLRTYHASDSPRHIAWKTVARTGRPADEAVLGGRRRGAMARLGALESRA